MTRVMVGIVVLGAVYLFHAHAPTEGATAIAAVPVSPASCVERTEELKRFIEVRIEGALGELREEDFHSALDRLVEFWVFLHRCAMELDPRDPLKPSMTLLQLDLTVFMRTWQVSQISSPEMIERLAREELENVLSAIERVQHGAGEYDH